jgi:hypothetical protein
MVQNRGHLGAWLMLIVFSFTAVAPAGAGRLLLCVGCDDVGLTLTQTEPGLRGSPDSCCETTDAPEQDQQPGRVNAGESLSMCDCVQVPVESHNLAVVPTPMDGGGMAIALISVMVAEDMLLDLQSGSITARGPPDADWLPSTQTLLGQRTSLII